MTIGPLIDGLRVVREGLTRDDRVVVSGVQRVRPDVVGRAGGSATIAPPRRRRAAAGRRVAAEPAGR